MDDHTGLVFDALRVTIIFAARDAPATPVAIIGYNDGERTGIRVQTDGRVDAPFDHLAVNPPPLEHEIIVLIFKAVMLVHDLFGNEFKCLEPTTQTTIVGDAKRLVDVLHPMRNNLLDEGPCADRLYENALRLVEDCLGHNLNPRNLSLQWRILL